MAKRLLPALLAAAFLAGPAAAQERQWSLDASGEDAYLVFGVPDTDDVGISLWCPIQKNEVNIFIPDTPADLSPDTDVTVILSTDDSTYDVPGRPEPNLEVGASSVEVKLPTDHPLFASMLTANRFRVKVGNDETVFPLFDADLSGLMELCRTP